MLPLLALASFLAQDRVDTDPRRDDTITLTISGSTDIDAVFRNRVLVDARGSLTTTTGAERGAGTIEGTVQLRLTASLQESVTTSLLFRNERLPGDGLLGANPEGLGLIVKEAWLQFDGVLNPGVSLAIGAQPYSFDLRGRGSPFFFDPYHSESFFTDINAPSLVSALDSLQPTGAVVRYLTEEFEATVAALVLIEGGTLKDKEIAGVGTVLGRFGRSRWGFMAAIDAVAGARTSLLTFGGGLSYREFAGWELYVEAYAQIGDRTEIIFGGQKASLSGIAHGFQLGARYETSHGRAPSATNYFLELNYTWLGNDHDITDDEENRFISYENVNDLLVLESSLYGLDLDTNFMVLKILAGMSPWERVSISGALGFAKLNAPAPFIPSLLNRTNDLGMEADVRVVYEFSRQVTIHFDGGVLTSSAFIKRNTSGAEDRAGVAVMGVVVRF